MIIKPIKKKNKWSGKSTLKKIDLNCQDYISNNNEKFKELA